MGRRLQGLALAGIAVAGLVAAAAVSAGTVERVRVGVTGRNATEGLSPALYLDVPVVADYAQSKFDGEQGDWQGPDYTATQKPGTGRTDLSFRSIFDNRVGSLDAMAGKALVHATWTQAQKSAVRVPRLVGGRLVGAVRGELVLYGEPITGSARWESVLAVPLCHGVFGAVDFYADAPPQDTSGIAGQYLVGTTPARRWNHDHALAAAHGVKLDGPLPGGRVTAHAAGRAVSGRISDCGGGLQHVPLLLQRKAGSGWTAAGRGSSGTGGAFRIAAHASGTYRVSAALGGFSTTGAPVVVR
jgi:hypothetical protein